MRLKVFLKGDSFTISNIVLYL